MLDLNAIRQRAASRASVASPANPANRLTPAPPISQLATLARVASGAASASELPEALAAAINRACDLRGDDDANRAGLLRECAELAPEAQADMLAHFTLEAARWRAVSGLANRERSA
jgi:hypothetical protein